MKKVLILLFAAMLFTFAGCSDKTSEPNVPTPEELTASIYDALAAENASYDTLAESIKEWADANDIKCDIDNNNIIVTSAAATNGHEKDKSTVFECSANETVTDEDYQKIAFLLYNACISDAHGPVTGIITRDGKEDDIPESYLNADNFINIDYGEKIEFVNCAPASSTWKLTTDIARTAPGYNRAYKIAVEGLEGAEITDINNEEPNPIKRLSNLLASWKSSGNLYELAEFNAGSSTSNYASFASIVVVIPENDEEKFLKKVEKMQSKLEDNLDDEDVDYRFTVVPTSLPEQVLTHESTSKLIPLLYTMDSGIYENPEDENENAGYTNLATVRLKRNSAVVKVRNFSMDVTILEEMNESVSSLAEISSFKSKNTSSLPLWNEPVTKSLLADLIIASPKKIDISEKQGINVCQKIKKINPDIECVSLKINSNDWSKGLAMFKNYYEKDAD